MVCSTSFSLNKGQAKLLSLGCKIHPIVAEFFSVNIHSSHQGDSFLKQRVTQKLPEFYLVGSLEIAFGSELELEPWLSCDGGDVTELL